MTDTLWAYLYLTSSLTYFETLFSHHSYYVLDILSFSSLNVFRFSLLLFLRLHTFLPFIYVLIMYEFEYISYE